MSRAEVAGLGFAVKDGLGGPERPPEFPSINQGFTGEFVEGSSEVKKAFNSISNMIIERFPDFKIYEKEGNNRHRQIFESYFFTDLAAQIIEESEGGSFELTQSGVFLENGTLKLSAGALILPQNRDKPIRSAWPEDLPLKIVRMEFTGGVASGQAASREDFVLNSYGDEYGNRVTITSVAELKRIKTLQTVLSGIIRKKDTPGLDEAQRAEYLESELKIRGQIEELEKSQSENNELAASLETLQAWESFLKPLLAPENNSKRNPFGRNRYI